MKQIVLSALYLLVLFLVSYFIFDPTHLYYEIWWLDIPMHILGGFGVASLATALHAYIFHKRISLLTLLAAYAVVAVAWEIYEYVHDFVTYQSWAGWLDTIKDFIDGVIGSLVAYRFVMRK